MKRFASFVLALVMLSGSVVYAQTDDYIVSDQTRIYTGTLDGNAVITNADFSDVAENHWARVPIVRDAALNLVKGYGGSYNPSGMMTNEEAITFIIRVIGREREAAELAAGIVAPLPQNSSLRTMWSLGNLYLASQLGLITAAEYADAITQTTAQGNPNSTFIRLASATRENVARWLVTAFRTVDANAFAPETTIQKVTAFSDYNNISAASALAVEALVFARVMTGYTDNTFRPKNGITRAEMAQILYNLGSYYFDIAGLTKKTGTVGELRNNQYSSNGSNVFWRNIYVRTADGSVDVLRFEIQSDSDPRPKNKDAVTLFGNKVSGMNALKEKDVIEYIVREEDNAVLYVQVKGEMVSANVTGQMYSVDPAARTINIVDSAKKHFIYSAAEGLFSAENDVTYLNVGNTRIDVKKLAYGSGYTLKLHDNTVVEITFVGEQTLVSEMQGIVIENNSDYGYLTVIDSRGREVTKYYYEDDITAEKQQYYDIDDEIGYIDSMFPDFRYDPRDCPISEIEAGDVVFITFAPGSGGEIVSISASVNYQARYGKIISILPNQGGDFSELLIEYENKQTSWLTVPNDIFVSKNGKPIDFESMMVGDWARLLVNQAILAPGHFIESVKEIVVESSGHLISTIVKGNFAGVNQIQKQIQIQNAQTLSKTGWSNYQTLASYSISANDIEFYNGSTRISLDFALKYFKRGDQTVYIALESTFAGERVRKITFRSSRDEVYEADTVTVSTGSGSFSTLGLDGISADKGTIVRRYGRLVDAKDVYAADYAQIVLNGDGTAAVINIYDYPDNSKVMLARGRILSIDDGKSFKIQSMSLLSGNEWVYTPVQREFTIDYSTKFINASGYVDPTKFIDYTDDSKLDKVFYIIYNGSKATHVVEAPYSTRCVKGTVYKVEGNIAYLKDASYLDSATGVWKPVSLQNSVVQINYYTNTIIAKNNTVNAYPPLGPGDVIRVFAPSLPAIMQSGVTIDGYVIYVD